MGADSSEGGPDVGNDARAFLPFIILFIGVLVSVAVWRTGESHTRAADELRFGRLCERTTRSVLERVNLLQYGLRGLRGIFVAGPLVGQDAFSNYVASRDFPIEFPGALGQGFAERVANDRGDLRFPVTYFEFVSKNGGLAGIDLWEEPELREAIRAAHDQAGFTFSHRLALPGDDLDREGIFAILPVFHENKVPANVEERIRASKGVVFIPFVIDELLPGLARVLDHQMDFELYDGAKVDPSKLLFDLDGHSLSEFAEFEERTSHGFVRTEVLDVAGRKWAIHMRALPKFFIISESESTVAFLILASGIGGAVLLSLLAWSFNRSRRRAVILAASMSRELREKAATLEMQKEELGAARDVAEASARGMSEFLANMSHEIRTPMNAIIGAADVLKDTTLGADQLPQVELLERASEHLLGIVNDVLDLSKIEAGRLEVTESTISVREVVNTVFAFVKHHAERRGIELGSWVHPSVPPHVRGDAVRLRQVLVNLVGNAVKFTERGSVSVDVEFQPRGGDAGTMRFRVRDTGIGMSSEELAKLFQRFSQANRGIAASYGGSGLGLLISRELVRLMGGELSVSSEKGKGSTFSFSIDVRVGMGTDEPFRPAPERKISRSKTAGPRRLLLVDDHEENRLVIIAYLRELDVVIETAKDGGEATARFKAERYDLILLDMQMPVLDGYAAASEIRRLEHESGLERTPIIALTAYAMKDDERRCRLAGCDGYLAKPVRKRELLNAVEPYLEVPADPEAQDDIDPGLLEFLPLFLASRRAEIGVIEQALEYRDFERIVLLGHRMRGVAGLLGFDEIAECGRIFEVGGRAEDEPVIRTALDQFREALRNREGEVSQ